MNGITIHQTALHAALVQLRERVKASTEPYASARAALVGLDTLTTLLDPYAPIAAAVRAAGLPEGRARKLNDEIAAAAAMAWTPEAATASPAPEPEAGTPAPPTITTTAGPGLSAQADGGGASAMEEAASPPLTPAPAQAAGGVIPRKRGRQGERAPDVWTAERQALLRDRYPHEGASEPLIADLLALPGPPFPGKKAVHAVAKRFGITVLPEAAARINRELAAHARAIFLARKAERGDAPPPKKWTPQRLTMLEAEWPTCADRAALLARINALPGDPVENVEAMRAKAKERRIFATPETKFALRSQGGRKGGTAPPRLAQPAQPAPPPAPVTAASEKDEAFEMFAAGLTVRDVHADLGTPISTLTNWHAEWQRTRVRPQQEEARV